MNLESRLQSSQIVCIEHSGARLYAEVIQVVTERQLCWARPLALLLPGQNGEDDWVIGTLYDLRQGADLLCPISLFRVALDIEVIPILVQLDAPKNQTEAASSAAVELKRQAHQELRDFIHRVWKAHPESFHLE